MLKTNSKKARENIRRYIIDNFDASNYTDTPPTEWHEIAAFILATFRKEKYSIIQDLRYYGGSEQKAFVDWAMGLPSILDTCYFYNRSAVADLGDILEETDAEKERYTEIKAECMLTHLIYRELLEGEKKNEKIS